MWSTPDLSDITEVLKGLVQTALTQSSLAVGNIKISCDSPDSVRTTDGFCYLTIYLLHVGRDPYWRNAPVSGPRGQRNNAQPLSLNLSYLLTAWCDKDFTSEQRAMSVALQAIHSQPIVTASLIQANNLSQWLPNGEFVVSIEADTIEEMSRLWQAFTVPIRLSALIRVGVVFIVPAVPVLPAMVPPSIANLTIAPEPVTTPLPILEAGASLRAAPVPPESDPDLITITPGPLVTAAGATLIVSGNGLDLAAASELFLAAPGSATEWNVTAWRQDPVQPDSLTVLLPSTYADPATLPPAATPAPGLYTLRVGQGALRFGTAPVSIAPRIDHVDNPPILTPDASGLYTITGGGFEAGMTTVAFGATPLGTAAFSINPTGTALQFRAPAGLPTGSYPIFVAVGGVAATTGFVVTLP